MTNDADQIVVLAGSGTLPVEICTELLLLGKLSYIVKIDTLDGDFLELDKFIASKNIKSYTTIPFYKLGKIIRIIKRNGSNVIMAGSLKRPPLYFFKIKRIFRFIPFIKLTIPIFDIHAWKIGMRFLLLKNRGDNNLISMLISHMNNIQIKIIGAHEIVPDNIAKVQDLMQIPEDYLNDVLLGIRILNSLAKFDIGQSIVIQNGRVLGIEAAEGTDQLIIRSAGYILKNEKRPILIKISKIRQELNVDMPTIGIETINNIIRFGYAGIVIENSRTIILSKEDILNISKRNNVFISAIDNNL